MKFIKLKHIAKYPTGKLNSNAATPFGEYPFFTCSHDICRIDQFSYDGEYVLLGGNNATGNFPIFYYNGKFDAYQRTYLIQPINKTQFNTRYLYYAIGLRLKQMQANAAGTATKFLTLPILNNLDIEYFSLPQQEKIASILSTYDDLIEKNNRKIAILQEMAEELYKEWFVRFRFPGHKTAKFKKSRIGRIPQDFDVVKMADVFDYFIGGGWGEEDMNNQYPVPAYVIRGTDFPSVVNGELSTCPYRYHKESNFASRQLKNNDIIIEISGGTAEQPVGRAILVDEHIIKRLDNKVICASFCKLVRVKQDKISPVYFNYWMKFLYDTKIIERFQLQSTGIINFKFEYFLRKGDVLLPPKELMNKFDSIVIPIRENIGLFAKQNENLKTQRDLLLPRLMSGKLKVKA